MVLLHGVLFYEIFTESRERRRILYSQKVDHDQELVPESVFFSRMLTKYSFARFGSLFHCDLGILIYSSTSIGVPCRCPWVSSVFYFNVMKADERKCLIDERVHMIF